MLVCEMVDLPGHSVAITSTCMERGDKIGTHGKHNFKGEFLDKACQFLEEAIIY